MVGFCDFVGVDIAPVSKKTAVKSPESLDKLINCVLITDLKKTSVG